MSLKAITIENFKGISTPVTVPLRPITLLFGANSAGKSTIIQAMQYAWEVLENRNPDVDRTRIGGEVIDLGGFRSLVHGHDLTRKIEIRLELQLDDDGLQPFTRDNGGDLDPFLDSVHDLNDRISVQNCWVELRIGWNGSAADIERYSVGLNGEFFGSITRGDSGVGIGGFNSEHPFFIRDEWNFEDEEKWTKDETGEEVPLTRAFRDIRFPDNTLLATEMAEEGSISLVDQGGWSLLDDGQKSVIPDLSRPLLPGTGSNEKGKEVWDDPNSMFWQHMSQIFVRPGQLALEILRGLRYLGPLREVPERFSSIPLQIRRERWATGLAAWDVLAHDADELGRHELLRRCSEYLNDTLKLGYTIRREDRIQLSEQSKVMAEIRLFATKYDEFDGEDFQAKVVEPLMSLPRVPVIQLHDEKNGIDVDSMDIGVGVSQVLPVVVGAVDDDCSIFAVEQPELHIHPAVQTNLADVFLREQLGARKRRRIFLLETHSEHLILRIMRRMRQTVEEELPEGCPEVTPDDVAVLYVETINGETLVREMPLNERGELVKAWPGGFFEEGLRETLD